ncbi:unnamed protein product [Hydatigera taeniaeformis]|uniref:DNA 3'-5' helicase n=1 Tax=Hydatigena taeniaeformis TaxID=6205 RepID=A0A0R3WK14_HYDTA|nr:unnamed protein product [Hydatigera taeniaeformis]
MGEPNPWDEVIPKCDEPTKPRECKSQTVLASRLKTNILTGGLDFHPFDKVGSKPKLPNFEAASLSVRCSSQSSSLRYMNCELIAHKENIAPFSSYKCAEDCSLQKSGLELRENPANLFAVTPISYSSIKEGCKASNTGNIGANSPGNSFEVKPTKGVVKKTGSFMSAGLRGPDETPQTHAETPSSNDSVEPLDECSQSIGVAASQSFIASMTSDKSSPSTSGPTTTSVNSVALRTHLSVSSGNYVKLNLRKKSFSRCGSRRQALSRLHIRRAKFAKKFGSKGCRMGNFVRSNLERTLYSKFPKDCSHFGVRLNEKEIEEMEPDYTKAEWRIADLAKLRSQFSGGPQLEELLSIGPEASRPLFSINKKSVDLDTMKIRNYMNELMQKMGIRSFRPGQERVIWRTLAGKSTLFVMPTAGGKSLCYQMPAAIFQKFYPTSTALVISPLISLMQDQVLPVTSPIRGVYISSSQMKGEKEVIWEEVTRGQYAYVLMSPEALVESDWICRQTRLPNISFVCIDEAHCLADWSHHFRPSYLQVCNLLRNRLGVKQFLGLSATCTPLTIKTIFQNLGMGDPLKLDAECDAENPLNPFDPDGGFLQPFSSPIPTNLLVTASMDRDRNEALVRILQTPPFSEQLSILIYAASRDLTERLAGYIRTRLQEVKDKIGRRTVGWNTAVYHAGLSPKERARVQKRFMNGKIRVLVATSAFGMGLNKQDLQAVIHFSMPKSFENYIQEIGRAGRNGQQSFCHIFLPPGLSLVRNETEPIGHGNAMTLTPEEACEANELRRHIFANHIDPVQLKRTLGLVFGNADSTDINKTNCPVIALDIDQISEQLDIKIESLMTLITYMHLRSDVSPLITILPSAPTRVIVSCYGGPLEMAHVSTRSLAVSAWLGHLKSQANSASSSTVTNLREVTLDLVKLCNAWGWRPDAVLRELRCLEWNSDATPGAPPRRTGVSIVPSGTSRACWLWVHANDQLTLRLDSELVYLQQRLREVERSGLRSLDQLQSAIALVAVDSVDKIDFNQSGVRVRSEKFRARVEAHFNETANDIPSLWPPPISIKQEQMVRVTVRDFMHLHGQNLIPGQVTGRVMANIFHGIGSPNFPTTVWSRVRRFWRAFLGVDWLTLQRIATEELVAAHYSFT